MHSLTYNSLTEIKNCHSVTKLSGSSRYRHLGQELIQNKYRNFPLEIGGNVYRKYLSALKFCDINNLKYDPEALKYYEPYGIEKSFDILQYRAVRDGLTQNSGKTARKYTLNKTKVRKKISAFARLKNSQKFIAFYSISFPANAPDNVLYKIFNSWLTNCRKRYGLTTYLWIAERQKNSTLHFHLLTSNKMNIKDVNTAMANTINNAVEQNQMTWGNSNKEKYNGVDVDSPQRPKKRQNENRKQYRHRLSKRNSVNKAQVIKWIAGYLTKYLTKNNIEFNRLPWHCSRDVSALFTSIVISDNDLKLYTEHLPDEADKYKIIDKDDVIIHLFLFDPPEIVLKILDEANQMVYDYMN